MIFSHILCKLDFNFNIIAVSETRIYNDILDFNPNIANHNFEFAPTPLCARGVGMYTDETMNYTCDNIVGIRPLQAMPKDSRQFPHDLLV